MPSIVCSCGHRIIYGEIPCRDEWLFISDEAYDSVSGPIDAEDLYARMNSFLKCPACARLWIFWAGFQNPPEEYLPAQPTTRRA